MKKIILFLGSLLFANDGLDYLNNLREKAGLNSLTENSFLQKAAKNHSNYMRINNLFSHYENPNYRGFTGVTQSDRAVYVGYLSKNVLENISYGDDNYKSSIDDLFSAIYHRFGFLDESINEIGMAKSGLFYTYDMGNSYLNQLCKNPPAFSYGYYYSNICATNSKISVDIYTKTINKVALNNPKIILWPPRNYQNSDVVFYEEMPDPLPEREVSGYPISVKFNKYKMKNPPQMIDFSLFEDDKKVDSKILTYQNDPNHKFNKYEFALFPLERLDYNKNYRVVFRYFDDLQKEIVWNFHTKKLNYPIIKFSKNTIKIANNKTFAFYVKPKNGKNILLTNCSYNVKNLKVVNVDKNVNLITLQGRVGSYAKCSLSDGEAVKFVVSY